MPIIKPYRQSIEPEGQVGGQATGSDFGGPGLYQVGQGIEQGTSSAAQAIAIIAHNKARQEASDADLKLTLLGMDLETELQARKQAHKYGDPDFTEEALKSFNDRIEKLQYTETGEQAFETNYGQRTFATRSAHLAKQYVGSLGKVQADLRGDDAVETYNQLTAAYSNKAAMGQNYLNSGPMLQQYEQSIRTGVFENMPAQKREELLRQGRGIIANSMMDGFIRADPRGAQTALQNGFLSEHLTKDQTSTLLDKAQTGVNMQDAETRRQQEAVVHATKLASESQTARVANDYLTARADPNYNPYKTQKDIFNLMKSQVDMTGPQIMAMVGALDSDIKEAKSGATQGNYDLDRRLYAKIAAGKMPDLTEINQARAQANHPISATQHQELVNEWNSARTEDGRDLQKSIIAAFDAAQPMVMPKDLTGVLADPESGERMAQLKTDVLNQIAKDRKEGKNPYLRVTPGNPDYMLAPEKLKQSGYVTPFLERIRKASERLSQAPGLPKTPSGGVAPELQRKPNESPEDYLKRQKK